MVGALLGVAYVYFYFYRFLYSGAYQGRVHRHPPVDLAITPDTAFNLAALALLCALVVFAWIVPAERTAIDLNESEVAWLLPAPLSRPQLLHFKLLKSQLGLLFFALLMTLVTGRLASEGHGVIHTLGWWIVLATFRLHRLGASFALTRLMDSGLSTPGRRLIVLSLFGTFIAALVAWRQSAPSPPDLAALFTAGKFGPYLHDLVSSGPGPTLLTPFRFLVQPWFAQDAGQFLLSLGPAMLVVALHYTWVVRSAVAFEEASVQLSEKRAAWVAARKTGDLRLHSRQRQEPIFALGPMGSPVTAFIWKAWIKAGGRRAFSLGAGMMVGLIALASVPSLTGEWRTLGYVCGLAGLVSICALFFGGPQLMAQGVRRELQVADLQKTAPVASWQIILGQMLGPSILIAATEWVGLLLVVLGGFVVGELPDDLVSLLPLSLVASGFLLLPFTVVSGLVPTGVMLLFPGWFRPGEMRGLEATGLGLLMVFVQFVFLALSFVAPALAGIGVGYLLQFIAPTWISLLLGALFATVILCIEALLGAIVLGSVVERFDSGPEQ